MPDDKTPKEPKVEPDKTARPLSPLSLAQDPVVFSSALVEFARQIKRQEDALAEVAARLRVPSIASWLPVVSTAATPALVRADADLTEEIARLRKDISHAMKAAREKHLENTELAAKLEDLQAKQRFQHLLNRVGEHGQQRLLADPDFRQLFTGKEPTDAYVLSIDLRRSTELMLKAREPRMYAAFLLGLAEELRQTVMTNFGIFDKFTGDGVLAFFPEFYSGPDAGLWAARTALEAHDAYERHYRKHRSSFVAVLKDAALGIGLDFGPLHIVEIGSELTVVGSPVVYACRMAAARGTTTLVNQPAYERLFERHGEYCDFREAELEVKHEGAVLAYELTRSGKVIDPRRPAWIQETREKDETKTIN